MTRFVAFVLFLAVFVATCSSHGGSAGSARDALASSSNTTDDASDSPWASNPRHTDRLSRSDRSDAEGASPSPTLPTGAHELVLDRAPDGHFYTDAKVGYATIHFLVDTGASTIALSRADAQAAGVQYLASPDSGIAQTAGGQVGLKFVKLDRVTIGPFEGHDVEAAVIDTPMGVSLLGQSWLRQVGTVTISGDQMTLR